jgi:hypothetical protein
VFYDLKTAMRTVRETGAGSNGAVPTPGNGSSPVALVSSGDDTADTSSGDTGTSDDADAGDDESPRWRRRNKR